MDFQIFKDFLPGLTAELIEAAKSVTNSLKSEGYLKQINPLVSRGNANYEAWVEENEKYFTISKACDQEKYQATLLTTGGAVDSFIQSVIKKMRLYPGSN